MAKDDLEIEPIDEKQEQEQQPLDIEPVSETAAPASTSATPQVQEIKPEEAEDENEEEEAPEEPPPSQETTQAQQPNSTESLLSQILANYTALPAAQEQARQATIAAQLTNAGITMAGGRPDPSNLALAQMPVIRLQQQTQAMQNLLGSQKLINQLQDDRAQHDPNSSISQAMRAYALNVDPSLKNIKDADGKSLFDKMDAATLNKLLPNTMVKVWRAQMNKEHLDNLQLAKQAQLDQKQDQQYDKAKSEMVNKFEQAKSRGVIKDAYNAERLANNAEALLAEYPDLNKMPQAQVQLFASEMSKIARGGAATEAGEKSLLPMSLSSRLQSGLAQLENNPTGATLGAFMQTYKPYLGSMKNIAQQTIGDNIYNTSIGYNKRVRPDDVKEALQPYQRYLDARSKAVMASTANLPKPDPNKTLQQALRDKDTGKITFHYTDGTTGP